MNHPNRGIAYVTVDGSANGLEATPAITLLAGLPSVRSGNFLHCLESDHVEQTVDLLSSPATLFLCHEDPAVLGEDHELITALENEAQILLFEFFMLKAVKDGTEHFSELHSSFKNTDWISDFAGMTDLKTAWKNMSFPRRWESRCGMGI